MVVGCLLFGLFVVWVALVVEVSSFVSRSVFHTSSQMVANVDIFLLVSVLAVCPDVVSAISVRFQFLLWGSWDYWHQIGTDKTLWVGASF